MTLQEFDSLSNERKSRKLFFNGIHLITKDYDTFSTALYHYNNFYVEVVYVLDTLQTLKINAYDKPPHMDLYLDEIGILKSLA